MCVTGEPDAVKAARPVWRGADGKVLRATGVTRRRPTLPRAFVVLPVPALGTDLIQTTLRLIVNEGLRGPDALQLASALRVSQGWSVETLFCCADDALLRPATRLGLPSWNPEQAG